MLLLKIFWWLPTATETKANSGPWVSPAYPWATTISLVACWHATLGPIWGHLPALHPRRHVGSFLWLSHWLEVLHTFSPTLHSRVPPNERLSFLKSQPGLSLGAQPELPWLSLVSAPTMSEENGPQPSPPLPIHHHLFFRMSISHNLRSFLLLLSVSTPECKAHEGPSQGLPRTMNAGICDRCSVNICPMTEQTNEWMSFLRLCEHLSNVPKNNSQNTIHTMYDLGYIFNKISFSTDCF